MSEQEARWIEKALQGDDNAFGVLVDKYQRPVFCLCYRMLGNYHYAEDATQESFIRAYQFLKRYDPRRSFATWLLSIAAHHCIDRMRKRQITTISTEVLPAETISDSKAPNPEHMLGDREKEIKAQLLLNTLKPVDRAAIILRYWHEYTEKEIAETLGLSVSAVKSRLYRARQSLAITWKESEQANSSHTRRLLESPTF